MVRLWASRRCQSTLAAAADAQGELAERRARIVARHRAFYPPLEDSRRAVAAPTRARLGQFRAAYAGVGANSDELVAVEGRVSSIRRAGRGMMFIDLVQDFHRLQLVAMNRRMGLDRDEFARVFGALRVGDAVSAVGSPGRTNVGELSLKLSAPVELSSPRLETPPSKLVAQNRNAFRVADYLSEPQAVQAIRVRGEVVRLLRDYLHEREFVEVQTPVISGSCNGASATPFTTQSQFVRDQHDRPADLQLRIAPELWLKRLVISGFDKVFEIGPVFRNEGVDSVHNPEFTTCEFYQSFTTLDELMAMTEDIFGRVFDKYAHLRELQQAGFKRVEFIPAVEAATGKPVPELTSPSLLRYLDEVGIAAPQIRSVPRLLDRLSSELLEPLSQGQPLFIYNQPAAMSPLSKSSCVQYGDRQFEVSHRFEMFINGSEYVNAYEEENDPLEQRSKFQAQVSDRSQFKDTETVGVDEGYLRAMEYGLPPTGGWGCGIDRLAMLASGQHRIERVLTFGNLHHVLKQ